MVVVAAVVVVRRRWSSSCHGCRRRRRGRRRGRLPRDDGHPCRIVVPVRQAQPARAEDANLDEVRGHRLVRRHSPRRRELTWHVRRERLAIPHALKRLRGPVVDLEVDERVSRGVRRDGDCHRHYAAARHLAAFTVPAVAHPFEKACVVVGAIVVVVVGRGRGRRSRRGRRRGRRRRELGRRGGRRRLRRHDGDPRLVVVPVAETVPTRAEHADLDDVRGHRLVRRHSPRRRELTRHVGRERLRIPELLKRLRGSVVDLEVDECAPRRTRRHCHRHREHATARHLRAVHCGGGRPSVRRSRIGAFVMGRPKGGDTQSEHDEGRQDACLERHVGSPPLSVVSCDPVRARPLRHDAVNLRSLYIDTEEVNLVPRPGPRPHVRSWVRANWEDAGRALLNSLEDQVEVLAPRCALILGCIPVSVDPVGADAGHKALVKVGVRTMQGPLISDQRHVEQARCRPGSWYSATSCPLASLRPNKKCHMCSPSISASSSMKASPSRGRDVLGLLVGRRNQASVRVRARHTAAARAGSQVLPTHAGFQLRR